MLRVFPSFPTAACKRKELIWHHAVVCPLLLPCLGKSIFSLLFSGSWGLCWPAHRVMPSWELGAGCQNSLKFTLRFPGCEYDSRVLLITFSHLINTCRWSPLMFKARLSRWVNVWVIIVGLYWLSDVSGVNGMSWYPSLLNLSNNHLQENQVNEGQHRYCVDCCNFLKSTFFLIKFLQLPKNIISVLRNW